MGDPTLNELKRQAKEANRKVEIGSHIPLTDEDWLEYGRKLKEACSPKKEMLDSLADLHRTYVAGLVTLANWNATFRAEALYWKQKYDDMMRGE